MYTGLTDIKLFECRVLNSHWKTSNQKVIYKCTINTAFLLDNFEVRE